MGVVELLQPGSKMIGALLITVVLSVVTIHSVPNMEVCERAAIAVVAMTARDKGKATCIPYTKPRP